MERLLHYVWKHKLLPLRPLSTTDGQTVEIIDPGLYNTDAGPDFFNAKVKIDGTLWVGNVEIHCKASEWFVHGHDRDPHYDNVVLHVVSDADARAVTCSGNVIPQMTLQVPSYIAGNYAELLHTDKYPPCHRIIPTLPRLTAHSWMSALQTERLEHKATTIAERVAHSGGDWEEACFATLARNYGFGTNGQAFETWATGGWLQKAAHHRDDIFQTEALFLGQAGLLDPESIARRNRATAVADDYFIAMRNEYQYLARKFNLQPMDFHLWKFMRLRPQNFPHIRLSQLANLYCSRRAGLSQLVECRTVDQVRHLIHTAVTPYWRTHYAFGQPSKDNPKSLSPRSADLLIINTIVPLLFAYGRSHSSERLCQRATDFLEQLKPEDNTIVRMWNECGLEAQNAADTQALIQLKKVYCDRRECLRCRIGYEYLKSKRQ